MSKTMRCPICKAPSDSEFKPFCSERCRQVDLHHWLSESYAVAGEEAISDESDVFSEDVAGKD